MKLKKLLALLVAAVMLLAMSATALAANGVTTNTAGTTMNIPITQTLYFKNAEGSAVYEPNLYYTYTITSGQAGATVKDHAGVSATVKAGDMRGFGLSTATGTLNFGINFSSDHKTVNANSAGTSAVTKKVTVSFDGTNLTTDGVITPGVYRYIITQTTNTNAKNSVGVVEVGTQDNTLVLDVTVTADGTVVGAVIHNPANGDNPSVDNSKDADHDGVEDDTTDVADDENGKQTGFGDPDPDGSDPTFEAETPGDVISDDPTKPDGDQKDPDGQLTAATTASTLPGYYDLYTTYNVTITKAVTGNMGDKSNFFPFQADISNSIAGAAFSYSVTDNGSKNVATTKAQLIKTAGTKTLGSATANVADNIAIKHGGKINLIGVPSITDGNVSVLANEYNNTGDQYKVTASNFGINAEALLNTATASAGTTPASFKDDTADTTFTVTNKLDAISPTGVVLRFAPYFAMMAGGTALFLVLFLKRRKNEEEEA